MVVPDEEIKLRAGAPIFVPSSLLLNNPATTINTTSGATDDIPPQNGNPRRPQRNKAKRRSTKRPQNNPNTAAKKIVFNEGCSWTNKKHGRRRNNNTNTTSRPSKNNRHKNSKPPKKVDEQEQHPFTQNPPRSCFLQEERYFPSLTNTSTTQSKNALLWVSSNHKTEILQPKQVPKVQEEEDEFARMGLQRLGGFFSKQQTTNGRLLLLSATEIEDCQSNLTTTTTNNSLSLQSQKHFPNARRRLNWNMDRLRDRWWDTLARRRLHRNVLLELQQALLQERKKDRHADSSSESEDDDSSSSSCSLLEPVEIPNAYVQVQETPNLDSAVYHKLKESSNTGSTTEVLNDIISRNDQEALRELLLLHRDGQLPGENDHTFLVSHTIYLCVEQDKPHLLPVLFKYDVTNLFNNAFKNGDTKAAHKATTKVTPLMLAAEMGRTDCLRILLSKQERNSNSLTSRDIHGDNVFHYCCRSRGNEPTLRLLLKELSSSANHNKWKQQQLSKMLLTKNNTSRTPLHIACEQGRADFVETFLSICSTGMLSKMLFMEDDRNQTPLLAAVAANSSDVVMSLIMWRGNHNLALRKTFIPVSTISNHLDQSQQQDLPLCPLAWAAKMGNLEMILLLLQFRDSSGISSYHVTEAIPALLTSSAEDNVKSDGIRALIHDGGNPFSETSSGKQPETAVSIAARSGTTQVISTLLEMGKEELQSRQQLRRRDPKLRQQPETFFQSLEATENNQRKLALTNALVENLCLGWNHPPDSCEQSVCLSAAATLYNHGATLKEPDIIRLRASLYSQNILLEAPPRTRETKAKPCSIATYRHYNSDLPKSVLKATDTGRSTLSNNSRILRRMPWMKNDMEKFGSSCPWFSTKNTNASAGTNAEAKVQDRVILVAGKNERFVVSSSIVAQKSAKFESAIRFAKMNESTTEITEIQLDMDPRLCKFMLQHIYHGSICTGWSGNNEQICQDLLDLMVVAEESLCFSLIQECEMRLLSSNPTSCFCLSCSKTGRSYSSTVDQDKNYFTECMYCVEGPSLLLTGSRVLDVLAICQYLESLELKYDIYIVPSSLASLKCITASMTWANKNNTWSTARPICLLKDVAIFTALMEFPQVVKSDSFLESIEMNREAFQVSNTLPQQILLLQTCLDDLFHSNISAFLGN